MAILLWQSSSSSVPMLKAEGIEIVMIYLITKTTMKMMLSPFDDEADVEVVLMTTGRMTMMTIMTTMSVFLAAVSLLEDIAVVVAGVAP